MGEGMGLKVAPGASEVFPSNTFPLLGIPSEPETAESFGVGGQRGHLRPPALRT